MQDQEKEINDMVDKAVNKAFKKYPVDLDKEALEEKKREVGNTIKNCITIEEEEELHFKTLSVKEFRQLGLLQEINRRFLHPRGLAMSFELNDDGTESFGVIWDCRDDPEGIIYNLRDSDKERLQLFRNKRVSVTALLKSLSKSRIKELGYLVEPIPEDKDIIPGG